MIQTFRHLLNLYDCDTCHLTNLVQVEAALAPSLDNNYLNRLLHQFSVDGVEQGVTGIYMWSGGHLSIHTWPERNMAAIDIISPTDKSPLVKRLMQNLPGRYVNTQEQAERYRVGREVVSSFSNCGNLPKSSEEIIEFLTDASSKARFNVVGQLSYDAVEHRGASLVLSESHFALHVNIKKKIVYADCFTCGNEGDPREGIRVLTDILNPREVTQNFLNR